MAKTSPKTLQERSAATAAKRERLGEKELRHRERPGIRNMLDDLLKWHGIEEISEAVQTMIINAHAAGPEGSAAFLATPRHEIRISESVAQRLERESRKEAARIVED
ncbi:MAG: hypothetical protein CMK71_02760 [Pseudomonadaceae bacterium]|nr:hypothetical protein [Pseudomonadaceae bacterium]|tara:strand:+ start:164 stop:484 length:321 start_codon:yes stop_codon:yes gene_type:complete